MSGVIILTPYRPCCRERLQGRLYLRCGACSISPFSSVGFPLFLKSVGNNTLSTLRPVLLNEHRELKSPPKYSGVKFFYENIVMLYLKKQPVLLLQIPYF